MASYTRGFSYLIAAQVQAVFLIWFAWFAGSWMNEHWPKGFTWYAVTIPGAVLGVAQTFYVVIRQVMAEGKSGAADKADADLRARQPGSESDRK